MNTYDVFLEVVESGSFSATAKKMLLSPSTVSKQMSMLEQKLGVQLFNRTTRSLSTTRAGELYYLRCKDISQRMGAAEAELKDLTNDLSGKLNITWPSVLSNSEIMTVLGRFCKEYPAIKVNIKVTTEMLNLTDQRIDFAFRVAKLEDSSMIGIKLTNLQPIVCATPEIISKHGKPTSIEAIMKLPHVLPTYYNLAQKLRAHFPEFNSIDAEQHHEVDDISALYNMAVQGMGATFLFEHMVVKELAEGTLIDLTKDARFPKRPVYLVYPKLDYMPKTMRCFVDFFKTQLLQ